MVVNRQRKVPVSAGKLEEFARTLAEMVGTDPESFTVALVSDTEIGRLNRRFRSRSSPTDVLSFSAQRRRGTRNGYLGDVVISMETARRQARRLGHSVHAEVKLLMVHGVLHLLGYDHETDQGQMNGCEHRLRRRLRLE